MAIKILNRDIVSPAGAVQWLVQADSGEHYIVSGIVTVLFGWEVLVFPADESGNVTDLGEVAGGRGISHEEAISDLEEHLSYKS